MMSISLLLFLVASVVVADAGMPQSLRVLLNKYATTEDDAAERQSKLLTLLKEHVECYVDRYSKDPIIPGRCVKLGESTAACLSQDESQIGINYRECRHILDMHLRIL